MQGFLLRQALPVLLAGVISFFVAAAFPETFTPHDYGRSNPPAGYVKFGRRHFVNLSDSPEYERELYTDWVPENPIVVFGSSELTHSGYRSIPYHFFTEHGMPCMGIGSSGNQCLNILAQIGTHLDAFKSSRVVIVLSPGWFDGEYCSGTPLTNFLSANNEHMLYALNENIETYPQLSVIDEYVSDNLDAINSPSSVLRLMAYRARTGTPAGSVAYAPFYSMHHAYVNYKQQKMQTLWLNFESEWSFQDASGEYMGDFTIPREPVNVNYQHLFDSAQAVELALMTNNQWYVEDSYYTEWMQGKPPKRVHPVAEAGNHELHDFYALVDFLKSQKMDVMFVMQPFNPYCFENLPELDPTIDLVRKKISDNGFYLADFYTSSKTTYRPAMLSDVHHLSEAGWYLVDSTINQHFFVKP